MTSSPLYVRDEDCYLYRDGDVWTLVQADCAVAVYHRPTSLGLPPEISLDRAATLGGLLSLAADLGRILKTYGKVKSAFDVPARLNGEILAAGWRQKQIPLPV